MPSTSGPPGGPRADRAVPQLPPAHHTPPERSPGPTGSLPRLPLVRHPRHAQESRGVSRLPLRKVQERERCQILPRLQPVHLRHVRRDPPVVGRTLFARSRHDQATDQKRQDNRRSEEAGFPLQKAPEGGAGSVLRDVRGAGLSRLRRRSPPGAPVRRGGKRLPQAERDAPCLPPAHGAAASRRGDRALEGVEARCGRVTDERQAIAAQIERDVCQIHVALEQRKQELLRQLELLMQHKIKTLTLQRERFELVGAQRKSCRDFVQESLRTGNQAEILGMKKRVVQKIEEIIASFDPKSLALHEEADIKFTENLREMIQSCQHFGRVYAQQLCPEKCSVSAPAAMAALVGETSTATLRAIDSEEQEWMEDIEEVSSELVSSDGSTRVSAAITKRGGNEYEINYRPQRRGRHQLHIRVDRNHVSGSPLSVVAHPKDLSVIRTIEGQYPRQVAFNRSGEMIVTEYRGHCVSVFSVDGVRIRTFGSKGSGLGELNEPHGITTDAQGNILVCDKGNHRIQKYAHDGANPQLIGMHGAGPLQFKGPYSIAVHPHTKKVYVADTFNCRIQVLNEDLSFSFSFGKQGSGKGEFESPCSIAFDGNGQLYVAEYKNRRIQVFSEHNQYLRAFGKELKSPVSIAIHGGVVYVTDHDGKSVALYTTDGEHVRSFQPFDGKPHGITVKDNGEIFVCYGFNDCIVVC